MIRCDYPVFYVLFLCFSAATILGYSHDNSELDTIIAPLRYDVFVKLVLKFYIYDKDFPRAFQRTSVKLYYCIQLQVLMKLHSSQKKFT